MLHTTKITFVILLVSCCSVAQAQSSYRHAHGHGPIYGHSTGYHRGHPIYHWNHTQYGYHFHGHALADVVRARGDTSLSAARARTQNEGARAARLDNDVKELETHLARRGINSSVRFGHLWERGEQARAIKASANEAANLAGIRLPDEADRLDKLQLHPISGRLTWPLLLQMEHFSRARKPVNEVFRSRAEIGQINPDHYLPLCRWIIKIEAELEKNVHNYPNADYAEAKDFLRRIVVEARLPATSHQQPMQLARK